jgi:hypothetical protein
MITIAFNSAMVQAQIMNIDRSLPLDSSGKNTRFVTSLAFSSDKNKGNLIELNINAELDRYFKNNYVLLALVKADATFINKESLQNDGFLHFRYRDNDTRKLSAEAFVQYQWNGAWGMEYRILGGGNLRYKLVEKPHNDLYTGLGIFQEWERWNWSGVKDQPINITEKVNRQSLRLNNYWKYSGKINDHIDVSVVNFLQFPFNDQFLQPRWFIDANMYVKTGKHFSFVFHWDHILDTNPAVPIDHFFYSFSTGIQINY